MKIIIFIALLNLIVCQSDNIYYLYNGKVPNDWPSVNSDCAGNRQSPIAINRYRSKFDSSLKPICFETYELDPNPEVWSIQNKFTGC
jgi:hypothetical protein